MTDLTFGQANGYDPLPSQAALGTMSQETTAALWHVVHAWFDAYTSNVGGGQFEPICYRVLIRWWVDHKHNMVDEAPTRFKISGWKKLFKDEFLLPFPAPYNLLQFLLRDKDFRHNEIVASELERTCAAYRVVHGTIVPYSSEQEHQQIVDAFNSASSSGALGSKTHLTEAAQLLTAGNWSGSMHESISAAESAAKIATGLDNADYGKALASLMTSKRIPGLIGAMMSKLYAYASSEAGVRHGLGQAARADVTEGEAYLVLSVSAACVSYLLRLPRHVAVA